MAPPSNPIFDPTPPDPDSLRAWRFVAAQETGILTNYPNDPGGKTKWGFSQRFNPDIDVAHLDFFTAYLRFIERYWKPLRCDDLPFPLALALVDFCFNKGADDGVRAFQRGVRSTVDGVIGDRTINAAKTLFTHDPRRTLNDVLSFRVLSYAESNRLVSNRGWIVRVLALRGYVEKEMS